MPNQSKLPALTGKLTDAQREKMTKFLQSSGVPDGVEQISFMNPIQLKMLRTQLRISDDHPAFSNLSQGRVFVPDEILDNPALAKELLLHEFGHFVANSTNEDKADDNARIFGTRYSLANRLDKLPGEFDPVQAPIETQLSPLAADNVEFNSDHSGATITPDRPPIRHR